MKKILILILIIGILSIFGVLQFEKNTRAMTEYQALALIKEKHPEFGNYPSDDLPVRNVESIRTTDGWRIGMYIEGSGRSGIIRADCFLVTDDGDVVEKGLFQGEGPATKINLATCTPFE
jgi:hypothetical protein